MPNEKSLPIRPQVAIMTSAGTLHPLMREKIETAFQCKVFNRYGSREVGDIASECEAHAGLHVFPSGNYIEIVDDQGHPVPNGEEGNILVTNLYNYAMPLIRYYIGDRGVLSRSDRCACGRQGQISGKDQRPQCGNVPQKGWDPGGWPVLQPFLVLQRMGAKIPGGPEGLRAGRVQDPED